MSEKLYLSNRLTYPYIFVLAIYIIICAGYIAHSRALWFDEFFTYYVAQLSNPTQIVNALLAGADNNAPLDYLIRHLFMQFAGPSPLSFRFPSLVMFIVSGLFLYRFVSFRIPSLPASVAFCFPVFTLALHYSYEGRPYALLFASSAMSLYFWQQCIHKEYKIQYLLLLFLSLSLGCYSHLYGAFNYIPIVIGEVVRLYRAKTKAYWILLTVILSAVSCVFLYPIIMNSLKYTHSFWAIPYISAPFNAYGSLLPNISYAAAIIIIVVIPLSLYSQRSRVTGCTRGDAEIPIYELVASITLCLLPVFEYIAALMVTNAFAPRFFIMSVSGLSILVAYACNLVGKRNYIIGIILVTCIMLTGAFNITKLLGSKSGLEKSIDGKMMAFIESSELPVIISHSHKYLHYDHYLPNKLRGKIAYVSDSKNSIKYLGYNTSEIALQGLRKIRDLNIYSVESFYGKNKEYYVLTSNFRDGWLIRKISDDFQNGITDLELILISGKVKVVKARNR